MKKVIIWGTGGTLRHYKYLFKNMEILNYCNNDKISKSNYFEGIQIIRPEQLQNRIDENPDVKIIIASVHELEIFEQCVQMGIGEYVDLFYIERNRRDRNVRYTYENSEIYYTAIYDDYYGSELNDWYNDWYNDFYKKEFLPCHKLKKEVLLDSKREQVFALKALFPENQVTIESKNKSYSKCLDVDHFEWFKKEAEEILRIQSKENVIISNVWDIHSDKKGKLLLHIVCDSLILEVLEKQFCDIMPNTYQYFQSGISFQNCYSCSDWTLPTVATIHTGKYPVEHQLLHPREGGCIIGKTISEQFHEKGWFTTCIGSNWRDEPYQGYLKGLDRMVYVYGANKGSIMELIQNFMETVRVFRSRDVYVILNVYDLHHDIKEVPDIGSQTDLELVHHFYTKNEEKTARSGYHASEYAQYIQKLKWLDYYLGVLYRFLNCEYGEECDVIFSVDHGHGSTSAVELDWIHENDRIDTRLASRITRVPLWIQSQHLDKEIIENVVDNTILFKILSLYSNEKYVDNAGIHKMCEMEFAYSESIYPGESYVAEIVDEKYHFYFETEEVVDEECMIPEGRFWTLLFDRQTKKEVSSEEMKQHYTDIVLQHIINQEKAHCLKADLCKKCKRRNVRGCKMPSYINKDENGRAIDLQK